METLISSVEQNDALQKIDVLNRTLEALKQPLGHTVVEANLCEKICDKIAELIKLI